MVQRHLSPGADTDGGALTDRLGRRSLVIVAGIIFIASSLGTALAPTVPWLIAARVVTGSAIGLASFLSPMYIAELVPARVRGALVAVNVLAITTGIVSASLTDYALAGNRGWRWMFGLGVVPAIAFTVDAVGHAATFWIHRLITVAAWLSIYKLVPETRGKTLEQIEADWHPKCSRKPDLAAEIVVRP